MWSSVCIYCDNLHLVKNFAIIFYKFCAFFNGTRKKSLGGSLYGGNVTKESSNNIFGVNPLRTGGGNASKNFGRQEELLTM